MVVAVLTEPVLRVVVDEVESVEAAGVKSKSASHDAIRDNSHLVEVMLRADDVIDVVLEKLLVIEVGAEVVEEDTPDDCELDMVEDAPVLTGED
jgi:hypothetical protein